MMNASIDTATDEDLEPMADLLTELFTLESDFQPDRDKQLAGLYTILDNPAVGQLFVLRIDGQVAGMANALFTVSTAEGCRVVLLEDVVIHSAWRGRGFGRRIVEHVLDWAAAAGLPRITLLADKDNRTALSFYEHLGFEYSAMRVLRKTLPRGT